MGFLPMNAAEMRERGWDSVDFVYVCGDSYVDHPSFGAAIITRVLEDCGCRVAFLAQPDWKSDKDFTQFGKPRLGFMVSAGNIDSMVAHYTVARRRRHDDAYTAGGKNGKRPDRAVTVYCRILLCQRQIRKDNDNPPLSVFDAVTKGKVKQGQRFSCPRRCRQRKQSALTVTHVAALIEQPTA